MKLTLDILEQQKKSLGVFTSNFETYTKYSEVANEEQKKVFRCSLVVVFLINLLEGPQLFLIFLKEPFNKKRLGNPAVKSEIYNQLWSVQT